MSYIWPGMTPAQMTLAGAIVGAVNIALLFRGISSIGRLTVVLWIGMLFTTGWVILTGISRFDRHIAFDFPPDAFHFSYGFLWGLGSAARIGIYDYLGYYDVCYIGEEVRNPGRVIPRSIIFSLIGVAAIYLLMNLSIIGNVSWREFVPALDDNPVSNHLVSILMERVYGRRLATLFTLMVLLTIFASLFAVLLGYSRIPYAASQDGCFFAVFGRLHPTRGLPHISLLAIGMISILACLLPLQTVIDAMIACRILVQFMGQVFAVGLLRRRAPDMVRPYRIWFYPVPCLVALVGWVFVFVTSAKKITVSVSATLALGVVAFLVWALWTRRWPWHHNGVAPALEIANGTRSKRAKT